MSFNCKFLVIGSKRRNDSEIKKKLLTVVTNTMPIQVCVCLFVQGGGGGERKHCRFQNLNLFNMAMAFNPYKSPIPTFPSHSVCKAVTVL